MDILFKERPDPKMPREDSGKTFVLVSGLPRSGTSLMMQMLAAGGLPAMTDNERAADIDNPRGYYEWEAIKQIAKEAGIARRSDCRRPRDQMHLDVVATAAGTSPLQGHLHDAADREVIASQEKMKTRLGTTGATLEPEQLQRGLHAHREETLKWLRQAPHIELMEVEYPALVRDAQSIVPQLIEFLGKVRLTSPENMVSVVDPALYRRKQAGSG